MSKIEEVLNILKSIKDKILPPEKVEDPTTPKEDTPETSRFAWLKSLIPTAPKLKTEPVVWDKYKVLYVNIGAIGTVGTVFWLFKFLTNYFNEWSVFIIDYLSYYFLFAIVTVLGIIAVTIALQPVAIPPEVKEESP